MKPEVETCANLSMDIGNSLARLIVEVCETHDLDAGETHSVLLAVFNMLLSKAAALAVTTDSAEAVSDLTLSFGNLLQRTVTSEIARQRMCAN
jgi:hypothetical protein